MERKDLIQKIANILDTEKDSHKSADSVFPLLDDTFQGLDDSGKNGFIELLEKTEEKVIQQGYENQDQWMSEIYLRKAICADGVLGRNKEYSFWKQAYEYALKCENHEVIFQTGYSLGFAFYDYTQSIREILDLQMNAIKAVCSQGTKIFTRLRIMGINLFKFWSQIEFRRLSEHELKAKQLVIDGAKTLQKEGFDEEKAAPIMVLLISKAFEFEDPCLEWAQHESAVIDAPVPEYVKKKLGSFLTPPV